MVIMDTGINDDHYDDFDAFDDDNDDDLYEFDDSDDSDDGADDNWGFRDNRNKIDEEPGQLPQTSSTPSQATAGGSHRAQTEDKEEEGVMEDLAELIFSGGDDNDDADDVADERDDTETSTATFPEPPRPSNPDPKVNSIPSSTPLLASVGVARQTVQQSGPKKLTEGDMEMYGDMIHYMGVGVVENLLSNHWSHRLEAVAAAKTICGQIGRANLQAFWVAIAFARKILQDKHPSVFSEGLSFGTTIIDAAEASQMPLSDIQKGAHESMGFALQGLVSNNIKVRDSAMNTLLALTDKPYLRETVAAIATEGTPSGPKCNFKIVTAKLLLLTKLVPKCGFSEGGISLDSVMNYTSVALENQNEKVRRQAMDVTLEVYRLVGKETEDYLTDISPATRKALKTELEIELTDTPTFENANLGNLPRADALTEEVKREQSHILRAFGEDMVANLLSPTWSLREGAITRLTATLNRLLAGTRKNTAFEALCQVLCLGFSDQVAQVFLASIECWNALQQYLHTIDSTIIEYSCSPLVPCLLQKAGSSNFRIRDAATQTVLSFAQIKAFGIRFLAPFVCEQFLVKRVSWRSVLSRLDILTSLVSDFGVKSGSGLPIHGVLKFVVKCLDHQHQEVRHRAIELVVMVYEKENSMKVIDNYLQQLNSESIRESLLERIEKIKKDRTVSAPNRAISLSSLNSLNGEFNFEPTKPRPASTSDKLVSNCNPLLPNEPTPTFVKKTRRPSNIQPPPWKKQPPPVAPLPLTPMSSTLASTSGAPMSPTVTIKKRLIFS